MHLGNIPSRPLNVKLTLDRDQILVKWEPPISNPNLVQYYSVYYSTVDAIPMTTSSQVGTSCLVSLLIYMLKTYFNPQCFKKLSSLFLKLLKVIQ